ncbi:MAG: lytic transglycosylase domain-containing protein [Egibacteraceae bacterium]
MRLPLAVLLAALLLLAMSIPAPVSDTPGDLTTAEADAAAAAAAATSVADPPAQEPPAAAEPAVTEDAGSPPEADALALPSEGAPQAPADPAALAALLTTAEQAVRDPARAPEELEAAGHWQQVAYRKLTEQPEWLEAVLAEVPERLHGAVRGNVVAGARLLDMHTPSNPNRPVRVLDLPSWRIVEPPPADELRGYYEEAAAATGVDWTYLAAINLVETRMGRIRGVSSAGAQGPMQFMPATWAEWGQGSVTDHRDAILAAGRYLQWGGMPGDVNGALFRYNRDTRYVDAVRTYAEQMQGDPRAYYGYYHWQVYYDTRAENVLLPHGWDNTGA